MKLLKLTEIKNKIYESIQLNKPFVLYRKPESNIINGLLQNDDSINYLINYNTSGFVFAPFDNQKKIIFIPFSKSEFFSCDLEELTSLTNRGCGLQIQYSEVDKLKHIDLINKGISSINKGELKKVVLSRKETINNLDIDLIETFKNLLNLYNNAFVYLWFHPVTGIWLGATPEKLLKVKDTKFTTIALAGTQPFIKNKVVNWLEKEIQEQKYVTDYLVKQLTKKKIKVTVSKPYTIKAGTLAHIKTDVSGVLNVKNIKSIVEVIHPTPAVCGLPKITAKSFIMSHENYDREYYTGFLGELNYTSNKRKLKLFAEFFVNLRCMKIEKNGLSIFVGGGITKDSNPEKEWLETVLKSSTMKNAIKSIL